MPSHLLEGLVIGLHLASWHSLPGRENVNPGLYLRTPAGLTAGAYRNSNGEPSLYAGATFETADRRFALTAGAVYGYRHLAVVPLLAPSVRVGLAGRLDARIAWIPKFGDRNPSQVLHLSLEQRF